MEQLPSDVTVSILRRLEPQHLCSLSLCARPWRHACSSEELWRQLYLERWPQQTTAGYPGTCSPPRVSHREPAPPEPNKQARALDGPRSAPVYFGSPSRTEMRRHQSVGSYSPTSSVASSPPSGVPSLENLRATSSSGSSVSSEASSLSSLSSSLVEQCSCLNFSLSTNSAGTSPDALSNGFSALSALAVCKLVSADSCCACSCSARPHHHQPETPGPSSPQTWLGAFKQRYTLAVRHARSLAAQVEELSYHGDSIEVVDYHRAMAALVHSGLEYGDVAVLLLLKQHSVLLNLLGLHYCIMHLSVEPARLAQALTSSKLEQRVVCVRSWSLGAWAHLGYRLRDDMWTVNLKLLDLVQPEVVLRARRLEAGPEEEGGLALGHQGHGRGQGQVHMGRMHYGGGGGAPVGRMSAASANALQLLEAISRGTVNEVMRVQISSDFKNSAWVGRDMPSQR